MATALAVFCSLIVIALGGLLIPYVKGGWIVAAVVVGLALVWYAARSGRLAQLRRLPAWLSFGAFNVAVLVIAVGFAELTAAALIDQRILSPYAPMTTVLPAGTDDWRDAHITADEFREPDPILWWRPVRRRPYNEQGFKGPLIDASMRDRVLVMTYGDSNTDGPDEGGWPARMQSHLRNANPDIDVVNAGVAGYSSYQGLRRFEEDVQRVTPRVVVVSFGWNDAALTAGEPDSSFTPPGEARATLLRVLLRYKSYLVLLNALQHPQDAMPTIAQLRPRVSKDEYIANIDRFRVRAEALGTKLALATRPHREPPDALRAIAPNFRAAVPDYNDALRAYAASHEGVLLLDVQKEFENRPGEFVDECHFSPQAHERMAVFVTSALTQSGWVMTPN